MTERARSTSTYSVFALACAMAITGAAHADTALMSMDDLTALDKQESWQELFTHLEDVPPTKRTDKWNAMLERSASGVIATYESQSEKAWGFADAAVRQYPPLKKSKKFMALRAQVAVPGLEACLEHSQMSCADRAVQFVESDPTNGALAWSLGNSIAKRDPTAAVRVYKRALTASHTAKQCADDMLKRGVVGALRLASADTRVTDARAIASDLCWEQLKEPVVDGFINGDKDYRKNTCGFLLAKKDALSGMSRRQCEELLKP